jgi:hypothetical protein
MARKGDKTNVITYADDFVVSGKSKGILEQKVKPVRQSPCLPIKFCRIRL